MKAICGSTDLSSYVGQGYTYERESQYSASLTTIDGTDYTAKIRDRVKLTIPFIPLTLAQLTTVLQLFPNDGSYVTWTYYDPFAASDRTVEMKYDTRSSVLRSVLRDNTEYYSGLVVKLIER